MVKPIAKHRAIEFDARQAPHLLCGFANACTFFVIQTCNLWPPHAAGFHCKPLLKIESLDHV
jgi:hypothetical protein